MLAMPRQTHPRTVASMKPPGTQTLNIYKRKRCQEQKTAMTNALMKSLAVKNAVKQRKETNIVDSRGVYKRSNIIVPCQRPKGFYTHGEALLAPEEEKNTEIIDKLMLDNQVTHLSS